MSAVTFVSQRSKLEYGLEQLLLLYWWEVKMVFQAVFDWSGSMKITKGAMFRYGLLERIRRSMDRRDVKVLAFGIGQEEVRLVLEGMETDIRQGLRGIKVGTSRWCSGVCDDFELGRTVLHVVQILQEAVVWAHSVVVSEGLEPLASPWTSHRDLLAFRNAPFFDWTGLEGRVDMRAVHERLGGKPLPVGWPPKHSEREELAVLLRIAGGVLGVLPASRHCFALFVHLAKARGWLTQDVARALALTRRRIRQLAAIPNSDLGLALAALSDARLARCP